MYQVNELKRMFQEATISNISQRKLSLLEELNESLDISIQFFGLEWESVLSRWNRIGIKIMFVKSILKFIYTFSLFVGTKI